MRARRATNPGCSRGSSKSGSWRFGMGAPYGRLAGAMRRLLLALPATLLWLALVAPPALAGLSPPGGGTHPSGGQGTDGETHDQGITDTALTPIAAVPPPLGLPGAL